MAGDGDGDGARKSLSLLSTTRAHHRINAQTNGSDGAQD